MTCLKAWVGAFLLLLSSVFSCNAQVVQHNISDDGYAHVPLQFPFPLYGRVFTESFMFSNGVVGFMSPQTGFCCSGEPLSTNLHPQLNYSIMPLWTDLINYGNGRFLSEGTTIYQRYMWENISQFGRPDSRNTFGVEIRPSGNITFNYSLIDIQGPVTSGVVGDASRGEFVQNYHGNGLLIGQIPSLISMLPIGFCESDPLYSPNCPGYQQAYLTQQCSLDPLYNSSCPGYEQAYLTQQCSLNSLYNSQCPGYEQAYFNQQCSINPLYNRACVGYESAYLQQQCDLSQLYSTSCPGYQQAYFNQQCSLNPLYNTRCVGYEQAYFNQQCTLNPLYNVSCPGYGQAYHNQQCSLNPLYATTCTGYQEAYLNQQCNLNPLYSRSCAGYERAYFDQQCRLNTLYNSECPGYAQAYFNQQCLLNPLYNSTCPGYQTAYYNQQCNLNPLYDKGCPGYKEAYVKTEVIVVKTDLVATTVETVTKVATPVENMVRDLAVSAPAAPTMPLPSAPPQTAAGGPTLVAPVARAAPTPTARASVVNGVKNAKSLADQVKLQGVVLGIMAANTRLEETIRLVDRPFYKSENPYSRIVMPQNRKTMSLGSDRLHEELVNSQYNLGN